MVYVIQLASRIRTEQINCPKYVEFYSKNKFEKLVHVADFIIRIYHDARSPEHHDARSPEHHDARSPER